VGDVIDLAAARKRRRSSIAPDSSARIEFFFDLACPFSYLAAERIERSFSEVIWRPASSAALHRRTPDALAGERMRRAAELRAAALRMPLEWPDGFPTEVPAAMRAAAYAVEQGRGSAFALAAGRLAFCGGFDLDDPEILAEAAAAAGVGLEETLHAARDESLDAVIDDASRRLLAAGADALPALRAGRLLVCGEERIAAASTAGAVRLAAL
jgi:2-hydroxychromene-2-carboxylate isomerase